MRWLLRRVLALLFVVGVLVPLTLTLIYRFVPPPITPLMVIRVAEGEALNRTWRPLDAIAPSLPAAVLAAEDNLFCQHFGLDFGAIREAWTVFRAGGRLRGASTVTQQTAKNLFLWPGRDLVRKGLEAYLALMLETLWPKRRILEVYLNIAEFDAGVYGAEAAAQSYFRKPAAQLTPSESALLASILPNPRARSAAQPAAHVREKAQIVRQRVGQLGPLLDCIKPD